MAQSLSPPDDRRRVVCRFKLQDVERIDAGRGRTLIRVSAHFESDSASLRPLLLVKSPTSSLIVREPIDESSRGERWSADFSVQSARIDEPSVEIALLLPDGRSIDLARLGDRRRGPRYVALSLIATLALTVGVWAAARNWSADDETPRTSRSQIAPRDERPVHRPLTPSQALASVPTGMSLSARARTRRVLLYRSARARSSRRVLRSPNMMHVPTVFSVVGASGNRYRVLLPIRPNGSTAWVRARDVHVALVRDRVVVDLTRHRIMVWRSNRLVARTAIGVGRALTPTPTGTYYVTALLKQHDPLGLYGPYAFALSGHSPVLNEFAGGNGRIGIHGTNQPSGIGSDVSHGCIRMSNDVIRRLAGMLALGTPVRITRS